MKSIQNNKSTVSVYLAKGKTGLSSMTFPIKKFFRVSNPKNGMVDVQYIDGRLKLQFDAKEYEEFIKPMKNDFSQGFFSVIRAVKLDTIAAKRERIEQFIVDNCACMAIKTATFEINEAVEAVI